MPLTSTKKIVIFLGVFAFLLVLVAFLGWLFLVPEMRTPEDEAKMVEGREFAKTTDQNGCITEGVRRARQIALLEIGKTVANSTSFNSA